MKPGSIKTGRVLLALFIVATTIVLLSWDRRQQAPDPQKKYVNNDTVPAGKTLREKKIRDLDDVIEQMDKVDLDRQMQEARIQIEKGLKDINSEKIMTDMAKAMKEVDLTQIQKELQESMTRMDFDMVTAQKDLKQSLKSLDCEKLKAEIEAATRNIDFEKIKEEIKQSLSKIDLENMRKEMEQMKKINMDEVSGQMARVKSELEGLGPKIENEMKKAKGEIEKAKAELKEYKVFVDGLDRDGLINKKSAYSIKHENGELLINGKKASAETYLKYRSFLEKHPKLSIKKTDDDFDMDVD